MEIIANFFDFVFENICPSGGVLKKPDGAGLDAYSLFVPLDGAVELKAGSRWVRSTPGMAGFGESPDLSEQIVAARSRYLVIAIDRAEMTRHLSDLIERPKPESRSPHWSN